MIEEKVLKLLVTLPFISILVETMINFMNNPVETIHGIYKFQVKFYSYIIKDDEE